MSGKATVNVHPNAHQLFSDSELVEKTRAGDQAAFSELVQRYHSQIFNMILAMVGDRDDADDIAQEAFLKAYRSLPKFQERAKFYTWVYRIAVNCCLDWIKSPRRQRMVSLDSESLQGLDESPAWGTGPEYSDRRVQQREIQEMLQLALTSLNPEYRSTLVLREIDGFSYEEISEALGCSVGTVKSRLFRARAQLHSLLKPHIREMIGP